MKKKLLLVGLVAIIALLVSACGGNGGSGGKSESGKSAYQLYNEASQKMKDAQSYAMNLDMKVDMDMGGHKMSLVTTGNLKQVSVSADNPEMEMDFNIVIPGQPNQSMKAYYKDGYYYVDMAGKKTKMAMPLEDVLKQANAAVLDLDQSMIKEQKVNGKELSFTLDKAAMDKLVGDSVAGILKQLSTQVGMTFSDVNVTATLDDQNQLSTINTKFSADVTAQGQTSKINYDMAMKVLQIGNVTIDLPKDLDSYTEATVPKASSNQ